MADYALDGVKVLDLTHFIAGPFCTKQLAHQGAEVIKIERPGRGDPMRQHGPFPGDVPDPEKSGLFLYLNTGKKSVTLNLKTETGKRICHELVRWADILVENFEPRVMPGLGLSYEELKKVNPRLVMTSISNYGQNGPYRDHKGDELNLIAMGGILDRVGDPDRQPIKLGEASAQYCAGLMGYTASMIGAYHAAQTGQGQHVDVSIMECMAISHAQALVQYAYLGTVQTRGRQTLGFPCKDGFIMVIDQQHHQWARFAGIIGRPEWAEDPAFYTVTSRRDRFGEICAQAEPWMRERTTSEVYQILQEARIPAGFNATPEDLLNSAQYRERGFFVEINHPVAGTYEYPGATFNFEGTDWKFEPAPLLGQHNQGVLCDKLGYSPQDLVHLKQQGII